jgi:hypothetical protein
MLLQQDSRSSSVSVMTSHPGYEFAIKHGIVRHSHKSFGDEWISSAEIVVVPRAELDFAAIFICYGTVTSGFIRRQHTDSLRRARDQSVAMRKLSPNYPRSICCNA